MDYQETAKAILNHNLCLLNWIDMDKHLIGIKIPYLTNGRRRWLLSINLK